MEKKFKKLNAIIYILPLIFGFYSYHYVHGFTILNSIYNSIRLYALDVEVEQINLSLEIARWSAAFATGTFVLTVISNIYNNVEKYIKCKIKKNVVTVFGDSDIASYLKNKKTGYLYLDSKEKIRGEKYIFSYNKIEDLGKNIAENLYLIEKNPENVYICSDIYSEGDISIYNANIINFSQIVSRLYWEKYFLKTKEKNIVIIGFGDYGRNILKQALLINVLDIKTDFTYHVFANSDEEREELDKFIKIHRGITNFIDVIHRKRENENSNRERDTLFVHDGKFYDDLDTLKKSDRIIITTDEDMENIKILKDISESFPYEKIHIRLKNKFILCNESKKDICQAKCKKENCKDKSIEKEFEIFGNFEDMTDERNLFFEDLQYMAKIIHARWSITADENKENIPDSLINHIKTDEFKKEWKEMSAFIKYSNIAQADHLSTKIRLVLGEYVDVNAEDVYKNFSEAYKDLSMEEKDRLNEIEHIRWMRYHYFNNWKSGERCNKKRIHNCLVPYKDLDDKDKSKDEDTFYVETAIEIRNKK